MLPADSAMSMQEDPVQREIHQDWANREYIELITSSIKKIADFLNSFGRCGRRPLSPGREGRRRRRRILSADGGDRRSGRAVGPWPAFNGALLALSDMSCRSRLATLNEKLTALERRIEYIEARVRHLPCSAAEAAGGARPANASSWGPPGSGSLVWGGGEGLKLPGRCTCGLGRINRGQLPLGGSAGFVFGGWGAGGESQFST